MKKLITILLVLTIVFSCFALVGCDIKDIIDDFLESRETPPEGIVKTKVTLENGDNIYISHSENFTQDDIDFVVSLHNYAHQKATLYDMPLSDTFENIINSIKYGGASSLFIMKIDTNKSYFICKYGTNMGESPDLPNICNISDFIWVKYNNSEQIAPKFDGVNLQKAFILYDGVIEREIASNNSYNKPCKYYLSFIEGEDYFSDTDKLMIYRDTNLIETEGSLFITKSNFSEDHKIYTYNGIDYLLFTHQILSKNDQNSINQSESYFGEYYNILYPKFVRFEKFYEGVDEENNPFIYEIYGIDISEIVALINE